MSTFRCQTCSERFDHDELSAHLAGPCGDARRGSSSFELPSLECSSYVVRNTENRTVLVLSEEADKVRAIKMSNAGLEVRTHDAREFHREHTKANYNVARCAKLFVGFGRDLGATRDAMKELSKLVTVRDEDVDAATEALGKSIARTEVTTKKRGSVAVKGNRKPKDNANSMCRRLLEEQKLTDEEIFDEVCKVYPQPEARRRTFVAQQRHYLKRRGVFVPPINPKKKGRKPHGQNV